jgi:hypothetical protein
MSAAISELSGLTNGPSKAICTFQRMNFSMEVSVLGSGNRWLWAANHQLSRLWILGRRFPNSRRYPQHLRRAGAAAGRHLPRRRPRRGPDPQTFFFSRRDHDSVFVYDQYLQKSADLLSNAPACASMAGFRGPPAGCWPAPQLSATNCLLILPRAKQRRQRTLDSQPGRKPTEFYACGTTAFI